MNTIELEAKKAELAREILNLDDEKLLDKVMKLLKKNSNSADEFQRIPGLPYTHEERMAELRRAEEQFRRGEYITSEELDKEMEKW